MRKSLLVLLIIGASQMLFGQENDESNKLKGELSGQWRTFYMSTQNRGGLQDFYALATGGKIQYIQPLGDHFRVGGAVYTIYNLGIQDLTASRYEAALFDVRDLNDPFVALLGEAYLQVYGDKHDLKIGRMKLNTPFMNPTDGWMLPTLEQGIWYEYNSTEKYSFKAGVINATARGTDKFYHIGDGIGNFGRGSNPDGTPSGYAGNTHSDYVAMVNVDWKPIENITLQVWDILIDNIANSTIVKPIIALDDSGTKLSFEWLQQNRIGNGGNADESMRYFQSNQSNVVGAQIEWKMGPSKFTAGYDHILKGGRLLIPREWGREPLFTFQRRERSEGSANNHGAVLAHERIFSVNESSLRTVTSIGHQWKQAISNAADNKYALPDYTHLTVDLFYSFDKIENFKPEFLFVYKFSNSDFNKNPSVIFNKVDMFQLNLILNYNF